MDKLLSILVVFVVTPSNQVEIVSNSQGNTFNPWQKYDDL